MNQRSESEIIYVFFGSLGRQFGLAVGEAIKESLQGQLVAAPVVPAAPAVLTDTTEPRKGRGRRKAEAPKARGKRRQRPCPVSGCTQPSSGPRFSFLCAEHRDLPPAERQKYRVTPRQTSKNKK